MTTINELKDRLEHAYGELDDAYATIGRMYVHLGNNADAIEDAFDNIEGLEGKLLKSRRHADQLSSNIRRFVHDNESLRSEVAGLERILEAEGLEREDTYDPLTGGVKPVDGGDPPGWQAKEDAAYSEEVLEPVANMFEDDALLNNDVLDALEDAKPRDDAKDTCNAPAGIYYTLMGNVERLEGLMSFMNESQKTTMSMFARTVRYDPDMRLAAGLPAAMLGPQPSQEYLDAMRGQLEDAKRKLPYTCSCKVCRAEVALNSMYDPGEDATDK